jgi:5' nucleotidase, deoxy (Pyrimidine), cytosolic type C protein (NT5C)
MNEQVRIAVDIDGVLSNFTKAFKHEVNSMFSGRLYLADDWEPHTWSWTDSGILTKEQEDLVWKHIIASDDFWMKMSPYDENVEALYHFLNKANFSNVPVSVFYITSRAVTTGTSVLKQTRLWLEQFQLHRYNTAILPVVHGNNSGGLPPKRALVEILGLDAMIDDYGPTVRDLGVKGWLLDRPWNRDRSFIEIAAAGKVGGLQVVDSLEEFLRKFEPEAAVSSGINA